MTKLFVLALAFCTAYGTAAVALPEIQLSSSKSQVEFLAVGTPSALKIRGKLAEPEKALKGKIQLKGDTLSVDAEADVAKFDTGIELRNQHMKEKYLETAKFPTAKVVIPALKLTGGLPTSDGEAKEVPFEGKLTLHGVEKPIVGKADVSRRGGDLKMKFDFTFKVQDFGVETPSFMGISVTKDVGVTVDVESKLAAG